MMEKAQDELSELLQNSFQFSLNQARDAAITPTTTRAKALYGALRSANSFHYGELTLAARNTMTRDFSGK